MVHGILIERILEWFAIPFSGGPCFVRTFHNDPSVCKSLHHMAHSFIKLCKALHNNKAILHEGDFWLYLFISDLNFMQFLLNSFPAFSIHIKFPNPCASPHFQQMGILLPAWENKNSVLWIASTSLNSATVNINPPSLLLSSDFRIFLTLSLSSLIHSYGITAHKSHFSTSPSCHLTPGCPQPYFLLMLQTECL